MKFLLLVIIIVAVYWIFTAFKRKAQRKPQDPQPGGAEDMVRCAECGLHLPRSESLPAGQAFYCSAEHRRLREPVD